MNDSSSIISIPSSRALVSLDPADSPAITILVFFVLYDGFRIATLTATNIVYSQTIAMIMVNVLIYFIISLIAYRLQNPIPMLLLVCMQISVIIIFTLLSKNTYNNIYPPRRVLMIYGNDSPESFFQSSFQIPDQCHNFQGSAQYYLRYVQVKEMSVQYHGNYMPSSDTSIFSSVLCHLLC